MLKVEHPHVSLLNTVPAGHSNSFNDPNPVRCLNLFGEPYTGISWQREVTSIQYKKPIKTSVKFIQIVKSRWQMVWNLIILSIGLKTKQILMRAM